MRCCLLLAGVLAIACGSKEATPGAGAGDAGGPAAPSGMLGLTLTVDGSTATFTDVTASATGTPFNRLRVVARRGTDPNVEELELITAGSAPLHIGAYSCVDQSATAIFYTVGDESFDDGDDCTITLTEIPTAAGQEAAGSFTANVTTGGSDRKALSGQFRAKLTSSN
jgi:hypothetical protein